MTKLNRIVIACLCASVAIGGATEALAQSVKQFRLGYFEGGNYLTHSALRREFNRQLERVLPEGYDFAFVPEGFRSAGWKRDSCRIMARQLTAVESINMVIAVGPWVVEDLLEAGFTRPILAMHQFDPVAQGLVGDDGRPIAPNLTVHVRPGKVEDDLRTLAGLLDVKKLGVLYFPSGDEGEKVISAISSIGKALGFEVVTAEGFDNYGAFAFFKAYRKLDKQIDALYLPPLWGMNDVKLEAFFDMLARDGIPGFTSESKHLVETGAFGTNAGYSLVSEARYNASKAVRIMQDELPADLPIKFRGGAAMAINEHTAQQCRISLPTEIVNEAYLVAAPLPEETPYYTLTDAIDRALSYHPGYLARYDALEAAAHAARQAYSSYLPQIVAGASVAHLDDNAVANSRGLLENNGYRSTLFLQQTIFSAEAIKSIQLAAKRKSLEKINLQQAKLDLEFAVTVAYLNYLKAQEILQTQRRFRDLIDRNLEIAGTRFLLEEGDRRDLLRFQDERYQATTQIIRVKSDIRVATVLLNVLFNLPGNSPLALDTLSFSGSRFWRDYDLLHTLVPSAEAQMHLQDFLVSKALAQSPVMRSFVIDLAIQRDLVAKNTARFYPALDFRASLWYAGELVDNPPVLSELDATWSVWGGLTFPIFLGTDRIRERAKLKARLSQVEFEKDAVSLDVMGKIRSEMYNYFALSSTAPRSIRSAMLAREHLKLVSEAYEAGKLGLVDFLDALENMLNAEVSSIAARYDYYQSMAQLVHELGWSASDNNMTFREEFFRQLEGHVNR